MPYAVLVPVFAKEVLHGGAHTFGFLMTASGFGAFIGTIYLASRKSVLGLGRLIVIAALLFAVGIAGFAVSSTILLSLLSLVFAGFGAMTLIASCNTILQTILEEDKRGRVMSFFTMAFMGMAPFGSVGAGSMAGIIGLRNTLLLGSACCLAGTFIFARHLAYIREKVRPIYVQMGIIKEVAQGMESAAEQPPLSDAHE
jgi:MFS family permease